MLVVAQVGEGERVAAGVVPVEGNYLPEGGGRDKGGGYDVMIVVAAGEYLVIALSVVWTEHQSYQWEL